MERDTDSYCKTRMKSRERKQKNLLNNLTLNNRRNYFLWAC